MILSMIMRRLLAFVVATVLSFEQVQYLVAGAVKQTEIIEDKSVLRSQGKEVDPFKLANSDLSGTNVSTGI